jgi:hypothetical protein
MLYMIFKNRSNGSPRSLVAVGAPTITLEREEEEEPEEQVAPFLGEDLVDEDSLADLAELDGVDATEWDSPAVPETEPVANNADNDTEEDHADGDDY